MTNIELQFMNVVPSALRDIAKALQTIGEELKENNRLLREMAEKSNNQ